MNVDPEFSGRVRRIAAMEPRLREVFLLSCATERTYGEIAEWLGISVSEVEELLAEAIVALARGLKEEGDG